jgi:hypothetical protein
VDRDEDLCTVDPLADGLGCYPTAFSDPSVVKTSTTLSVNYDAGQGYDTTNPQPSPFSAGEETADVAKGFTLGVRTREHSRCFQAVEEIAGGEGQATRLRPGCEER